MLPLNSRNSVVADSLGDLPGSTNEKACCGGRGSSGACSDGSIGPGTRRRCCVGRDIGSGGVRTGRRGRGRIGRICGRTINRSLLGIERIQPARQSGTGKNPRSGPPSGEPSSSQSSAGPKCTGAVSKCFAAGYSDAGSAACPGADSPTRPNSGMTLGHRATTRNANGVKDFARPRRQTPCNSGDDGVGTAQDIIGLLVAGTTASGRTGNTDAR
jgi:hypothetical protein